MDRKHYLDNLRSLAILLLFPYHTFMIYNNWGERFYISGDSLFWPSLFIRISAIWMMPLLFVIAGMSTFYALKTRSASAYLKERVRKLLIPLIFGLLLIVPVQSYLAETYHTGSANILHYFTDFSDLSGTGGGFTTGQLWFILYLFLFSLLCVPPIALIKWHTKQIDLGKIPLIALILMGIVPVLAHPLLNIGGKSIVENLFYFLAGFFLLSSEDVLQKLDQYRFALLFISVICCASSIYFDNIFFEAASFQAILAILGLGHRYLNFSGKIPEALAKSSFGVYLFHQSWIVVAAFFIFQLTENPIAQIPLILLSAIVLTYLTYEICRRISPLKFLFGLKK
jgi:surface polysaccharide O-acyltransferase-like enzyme